MASSLDSCGKLPLMLSAGTGDPPGKDLAALGEIPAELGGILVVDIVDLIDAEVADLPALPRSVSVVGHNDPPFRSSQNGRLLSSSSRMEKSEFAKLPVLWALFERPALPPDW